MGYQLYDTIVAIGSAPGGAARGIVRLSGREALAIARRCFVSSEGGIETFSGPSVLRGAARIGFDGEEYLLPAELFIWPDSRSYTREPAVEFHSIGSSALLTSLVEFICHQGARLAAPGEFTLRAFLAGRLDLTQAEGVLGVINATSRGELRSALDQLAGGLGKPLNEIRSELVHLLAELEAGLDFVEEDIEFIHRVEVMSRLEWIDCRLDAIEQQIKSRDNVDSRERVVLVGKPNAGKSSLFNALVQKYRGGDELPANISALVSPVEGTTRDYLTGEIELGGIRCALIDTAGVPTSAGDRSGDREAEGSIDAAAFGQASDQSRAAALRIICIDASAASESLKASIMKDASLHDSDIVALTKIDALASVERQTIEALDRGSAILTSAATGEGLASLVDEIRRRLAQAAPVEGVVAATTERCAESVRQASLSVRRALQITDALGGDELLAAEIRAALTEVGKIVGAVYTEDVLDQIFRSFCIGK